MTVQIFAAAFCGALLGSQLVPLIRSLASYLRSARRRRAFRAMLEHVRSVPKGAALWLDVETFERYTNLIAEGGYSRPQMSARLAEAGVDNLLYEQRYLVIDSPEAREVAGRVIPVS